MECLTFDALMCHLSTQQDKARVTECLTIDSVLDQLLTQELGSAWHSILPWDNVNSSSNMGVPGICQKMLTLSTGVLADLSAPCCEGCNMPLASKCCSLIFEAQLWLLLQHLHSQ